MTARLQVYRSRPNHAIVVGASEGSAEARQLAAWLSERLEVIRFEQRAATGTIHIEYDDGAALAGRFIRSLRDKVSAIERARRPPEPFQVTPVHSLCGRVRVRTAGITDRDLTTLAMVSAGLPGVQRTRHFPGSRTMLVEYDAAKLDQATVLAMLRQTDRWEWSRDWHHPGELRWGGALLGTWTLLLCITRAWPVPLLALSVALNTVRPVRRSITALRDGTISIDLLDVAATFAALATGRPTTAAFVIWMVGIGDLLLDISANNARSALSMLMRRGDQVACRVGADGNSETVPARELRIGDRFVVHTGRAVAADGVAISGLAEVDEKALNGESQLLTKRAGDPIFASTVVVEGSLVVEVTRSATNTEAAKIERILNTVGSKPLTLQRDALALGSKLVLPTFAAAWLAAALSGDVTRAVCVLITDFGTGIRIAVPTTALTAMALAARERVLVKGAQYLERLSKADVIVFDKTGTLTNGVPEVVEVVCARGARQADVLELCASAEAHFDHPVARAVKSYAATAGLHVVDPEPGSEDYSVGQGLRARVRGHRVCVGRPAWLESQHLAISTSFARHIARFKRHRLSSLAVAVDGRVVGLIAYADGTRPESAAMVRALRANGRRSVVLLSGDSPAVVKTVARSVGIDEAVGGLLPQQKADYVRRMRAGGCVVAMVGDGINDAPALASADVGIALAGSADVALETADVVLLDGGLTRLVRAFHISEQAMTSVRRNLGLIIAPNAAAIVAGACGLIGPALAAIINNGATILAVLVGTAPLLRRRSLTASASPEGA